MQIKFLFLNFVTKKLFFVTKLQSRVFSLQKKVSELCLTNISKLFLIKLYFGKADVFHFREVKLMYFTFVK